MRSRNRGPAMGTQSEKKSNPGHGLLSRSASIFIALIGFYCLYLLDRFLIAGCFAGESS